MKMRKEEQCRFIDISRYILFMPVPHSSRTKTLPNRAPFLYPARFCRAVVTQMGKQPRCFIFKRQHRWLMKKMAKKWKTPFIVANQNGETPSQLRQHPKNADPTSQEFLLDAVFGEMFASPLFSSPWSVRAIVLKRLCVKRKAVSTGVTLHSQRGHGKRQSAASASLKRTRCNFVTLKFRISTVNSNVCQGFFGGYK